MEDERFKDFLQEYVLSDYTLQEFYDRFNAEVLQGLGRETNKHADTKCYITYVQDLPTGDETGKYMALDLGGSKFRVLLITLKGNHDAGQESKVYDIPLEILRGTGRQLFDYIAKCLSEFVHDHKLGGEVLPLGFTFSFPCVQQSLTKAILVRWTKNFSCSGVVNADVGRLLKEAIIRRGDTHINMVAILNDTTGTLMSCAHRNPSCRIGLIVGTGCNACYMERVENVELLEQHFKNKPQMIINVESGAFGEKGQLDFIRTDVDHIIDNRSINQGKQIFEKMLSGMYLGEQVRLTLLRATKENLIFSSCAVRSKILHVLFNHELCFKTRYISDIEREMPFEVGKTKEVLKEIFGLSEFTDEDCQKVRYVCECISRRSGMLIGVAIGGLINKMSEPKTVVAVDGSVYRYHPRYDSYMREGIDKFLDTNLTYDLMLSEDGSGRGAALVAAVAAKEL